MVWPLSRRMKRDATSSRRSTDTTPIGRKIMGRRAARSLLSRMWSSPDPSTMTTSRPSSSVRSATIEPSWDGSRATGANPLGAASSSSVPGDSSGSQVTGSEPTGMLGSWAKPQPPSSGEIRTSGLRIDMIARDLALDSGEVAPVFGVATQEFDGEAGTFEAIQVIDRLRRAPILCGHGVSSRLAPLFGELQSIRKRGLCARPYDCIACDDNPYNRRVAAHCTRGSSRC